MPPKAYISWRKVVNGGTKLLIIGFLAWALYHELQGEVELRTLRRLFGASWEGQRGHFLLLAIGLMPLNWALEVQKWRIFLSPFWLVPVGVAWRAVFAGVALSLFTPNRIGEYGGRVLAVPAQYNWAAVLATAAGSLAQLIALLGGGLAGVFFYLRHRQLLPELWESMGWVVLLSTLLVLALFLYLPRLAVALRWLPLPEKWWAPIAQLKYYRRWQLLHGLGWAVCRYSLYSFQFYLLLRFFGLDLPLGAALGGIATIFLVQLFLPLPPVAALLARGELALLIWSPFAPGKLGILAATFSLFIINLLLPALLGAVFIVKINVLKSLGYDQEAKRYDSGPDASNGIYSPSTETMENSDDSATG